VRTYVDTQGRAWPIRVTVATLRRCRDICARSQKRILREARYGGGEKLDPRGGLSRGNVNGGCGGGVAPDGNQSTIDQLIAHARQSRQKD